MPTELFLLTLLSQIPNSFMMTSSNNVQDCPPFRLLNAWPKNHQNGTIKLRQRKYSNKTLHWQMSQILKVDERTTTLKSLESELKFTDWDNNRKRRCGSEFLFTTYLLRQLSNISPEHLQEGNVGHNPSFPTSMKGRPLSLRDKIKPSEGKQKISGLEGNIF